MKKFLIGGSPCTHWSIAQKKNRETTAEGIGWELFKNYIIAKEKFKPDFFLYENNKSAAQAIKDQIATELEAPLQYINSALVSEQNRQRFYVHNFGKVPLPEDRGIMLKDILESGESWIDKAFAYTTRCAGAIPEDTLKRHRHTMVAENVTENVAEAETVRRAIAEIVQKYGYLPEMFNPYNRTRIEGKSPTLSTGSMVTSSCATILIEKASENTRYAVLPNGRRTEIYRVENGFVEIKGERYKINLENGFYIFRKLTVTEAERLQTLPDGYTRAASNAQAYKGLGNGWTAEVIIHLLSYALKDIPKDEEIIVLSMYDGIGTGRYCFDKLGYHNIKYYAYEIDKYAMQIANSNYADIIQCGDAFQVREEGWGVEQ